MYFTLGFIIHKYLSEKIEKHANDALVDDEVTFKELWVMKEIKELEAKRADLDKEIEGYLKELGLA
uniref:hypothetical protein n=1 Tax=Prevotella sp. TaxID=59823 RepID=UPI0030786A61